MVLIAEHSQLTLAHSVRGLYKNTWDPGLIHVVMLQRRGRFLWFTGQGNAVQYCILPGDGVRFVLTMVEIGGTSPNKFRIKTVVNKHETYSA